MWVWGLSVVTLAVLLAGAGCYLQWMAARMFHSELLRIAKDFKTEQERNDRLVEALARKSGVDLILPQPEPLALEKSAGWWDRKEPN